MNRVKKKNNKHAKKELCKNHMKVNRVKKNHVKRKRRVCKIHVKIN